MAIRGQQTVRFMQPGVKGDTGYDGCSVRITVWQSGKEYRNDSGLERTGVRYLDVCLDRAVSLYGHDTYNAYVCRVTHTSSKDIPLAEGTYWEKAEQLRPLITPLILTEQLGANYINVLSLAASEAFIDALTVKSMDTMPGQNGNKFVINGDEIKIIDDKGVAVGRIVADSIANVEEEATTSGNIILPQGMRDIDCDNKWGTETVLDTLIPIGTGQMSQGDTFNINHLASWLSVYCGPLNYNGSVSSVTNFRAEYTLYVSLYNGPIQNPDSFVERLYEESWTLDATDIPRRYIQQLEPSKSFTGDIPADGYYYLRVVVTCQVSGPGTNVGPYTFPASVAGNLHFFYQRTNLTVMAIDGMLCRFGTTEQNRKFFKVSAADGSIEGRIGGYGFKVTEQGLVLYNGFYAYKTEENSSGFLVFRKEV